MHETVSEFGLTGTRSSQSRCYYAYTLLSCELDLEISHVFTDPYPLLSRHLWFCGAALEFPKVIDNRSMILAWTHIVFVPGIYDERSPRWKPYPLRGRRANIHSQNELLSMGVPTQNIPNPPSILKKCRVYSVNQYSSLWWRLYCVQNLEFIRSLHLQQLLSILTFNIELRTYNS